VFKHENNYESTSYQRYSIQLIYFGMNRLFYEINGTVSVIFEG